MYAIIETGGKQYKVSPGDVISVEKIECNVGDKITFDKVLAKVDNDVTLGNPVISGQTVTGTCTKQDKAKKVIVYKYKRKSGYHKKNGHRQLFTEVKIDSV